MRKGVSPVVAIVLLIAIAVISAVAVWSWVSPLTSKPATGSTAQYSAIVWRCYPDPNTLDIKNTGGLAITLANFTVINSTGGNPGNTSMAISLVPGDTASSVTAGVDFLPGQTYKLRSTIMPDINFNC